MTTHDSLPDFDHLDVAQLRRLIEAAEGKITELQEASAERPCCPDTVAHAATANNTTRRHSNESAHT